MTRITRRRFGTLWVSALSLSIAGCAEESGDDEVPVPDEQLSRSEAAVYADGWVQDNLASRDEEAFEHYRIGTDAIADEDYSRAIREFELATNLYEKLEQDVFEKRSSFQEEQSRHELFSLAWEMYRLMHESAASWYNATYALQVENSPEDASEWREQAEEQYEEASQVSAKWQDILDEWKDSG